MSARLVFVHGAGFTRSVFEAQREAFPGSRAVNLPGHQRPGEPSAVRDFADFLAQYLTEEGLGDTVVCGHSLGGAVALDLALRADPRLAALVLIGSGARLRVAPELLTGLREDFPATARKIASYLYADSSSPLVAQAVASFEQVGQAQTLRDFSACNAFDVSTELGNVRVPVLTVTGKRDLMTPPKYAQFVADRVTNGSLALIEDAGHMVMQERPAETNMALMNFVTGLEGF